jgi:hypothetical protein
MPLILKKKKKFQSLGPRPKMAKNTAQKFLAGNEVRQLAPVVVRFFFTWGAWGCQIFVPMKFSTGSQYILQVLNICLIA